MATTTDDECRARAMPAEPCFTLLARDPMFATLVRAWAERRLADIDCGDRPQSDLSRVEEAKETARLGEKWRSRNSANDGRLATWRIPKPNAIPAGAPSYAHHVSQAPMSSVVLAAVLLLSEVTGFNIGDLSDVLRRSGVIPK